MIKRILYLLEILKMVALLLIIIPLLLVFGPICYVLFGIDIVNPTMEWWSALFDELLPK